MSDNTIEFRNAMGNFCSGVVVVTGIENEAAVGFTAQSFVSLSLAPKLIAICPAKSSASWGKIRESGSFCINVLTAEQTDLSNAMARSGGNKFEGIDWRKGETGSPILQGSLCHIDCKLLIEHDAGDHTIAVGEVIDFQVAEAKSAPLLFFGGSYGDFIAR